MKARCVLEFDFPDRSSLAHAAKAISHEGNVGSRSGAEVTEKGKTLAVEIRADDVVSLRAGANAYLRAMQIIESVDEVPK